MLCYEASISESDARASRFDPSEKVYAGFQKSMGYMDTQQFMHAVNDKMAQSILVKSMESRPASLLQVDLGIVHSQRLVINPARGKTAACPSISRRNIAKI
jgi:hypothetical protein